MSHPHKDRPVNKATMDAPQEEFVEDQSAPSSIDPQSDEARHAELKSEVTKVHPDSDPISDPKKDR